MTRIHEVGSCGPVEPVSAVSYVVMHPGDMEIEVSFRLVFCRQAAERSGHLILPTGEFIEQLSYGSARRPAWRRVCNMITRMNARHVYYFELDQFTGYSSHRRRTLRRIWSPRGVQIHFLGGGIVRPTILQPTIIQSTIAEAAPARTTEHFRGIVL